MPSGSLQKQRTKCPSGHPYDEANTYWKSNEYGVERICRTCAKLRQQRRAEMPGRRELNAQRMREWRAANPDRARASWRAHDQKTRQLLLDARAGGCIRCPEKHPACLDFHHRNGKKDKLGHIGQFRRFGHEQLLAEIAKCDVLCSNCHRKHHHKERSKLMEAS